MKNLNLEIRKIQRDEFAKNIVKAAKISGKSQADISNDLNLPPTTVNGWFKARQIPRDEVLNILADYLGTTVYDLLKVNDEFIELSAETIEIPVYKSVKCGDPSPESDDIVGYIYIDEALAKRGEHFAVKAKGDSMLPSISEGDTLLVRKQKTVNSGEIAIVKVNGNESTCKKVVIRHDGITLQPLNGEFEAIFYSKEQIEKEPVEILGKVIESRKKF